MSDATIVYTLYDVSLALRPVAVIAIELLAACQAIEFLRPLKTTQPLEEVCKLVRNVVRQVDEHGATCHKPIT